VITAYLFLAQALAQPGGVGVPLAILPQLGISLLLYPLIARLVALFDRFRLMPVREA
jgi:hypothetical protein